MKKNLFVFVAGLISALAVTNETHAQSLEAIASTEPIMHHYKIGNIVLPNNSNTIALDIVNVKALKNFSKHYKVSNETWSNGEDCIVASYDVDSVSNYIYYDKKGHWGGSLKVYQEDKMPMDIRKMVKQEYYDYNIVVVNEIETDAASAQPTYIVIVENEKNIKQIRIQNDNMEVYREFKRS